MLPFYSSNPVPYNHKDLSHGVCTECFTNMMVEMGNPAPTPEKIASKNQSLKDNNVTSYCGWCKKLLYDRDTGTLYDRNSRHNPNSNGELAFEATVRKYRAEGWDDISIARQIVDDHYRQTGEDIQLYQHKVERRVQQVDRPPYAPNPAYGYRRNAYPFRSHPMGTTLQCDDYDCGHACLDMLGYDGHAMFPNRMIGSNDILSIKGAVNVTVPVGQEETLDYSKPHIWHFLTKQGSMLLAQILPNNYTNDELVAAINAVGNQHWAIRYEDTIHCPKIGVWRADDYKARFVGNVLQEFLVPPKTPSKQRKRET